jgi:heptosyltransferase-2
MKVLIIRFSSLGDIVLTFPITRAIHSWQEEAEIHFLTKPQFAPLFTYHPFVKRVIYKTASVNNVISLLKKEHYDYVVDLHAKLSSFIVKKRIGASKTATYRKHHFYRWLMAHTRFGKKLSPIRSTVDLYASALDRLGIPFSVDHQLELFLPPSPESVIAKFDLPATQFRVAIVPGAAHPTKQYPLEYYYELIRLIRSNDGAHIVLLGNSDEKKLTESLAKDYSSTEVTDLAGKTDVMELACVLQSADIVISGDCGPMHVAAALEKPQIAIFGSTHPMLGFAPLNRKAIILQKDLACRPCTLHGREQCPQKHFRCMKDISPQEIMDKIKVIKDWYENRTAIME